MLTEKGGKIKLPNDFEGGAYQVYIQREDKIYEVQRTYQNGMWMDLYASESSLKKEEIQGWNL